MCVKFKIGKSGSWSGITITKWWCFAKYFEHGHRYGHNCKINHHERFVIHHSYGSGVKPTFLSNWIGSSLISFPEKEILIVNNNRLNLVTSSNENCHQWVIPTKGQWYWSFWYFCVANLKNQINKLLIYAWFEMSWRNYWNVIVNTTANDSSPLRRVKSSVDMMMVRINNISLHWKIEINTKWDNQVWNDSGFVSLTQWKKLFHCFYYVLHVS